MNAIKYIIIIFFVLNSGSLLVRTLGDDIFYIFEFLLVFFIFIKYSRVIRTNHLHYSLFVFSLVAHYLIFFTGINAYLGLIMRLTTVLLLSNIMTGKEFWKKYERVMIVLSVSSIIGFLIVNSFLYYYVIGYAKSFLLYDKTALGSLSYNNLGFITWPVRNFYPLIRNQSIFWEPGAYQFFINIALIQSIKRKGTVFNTNTFIFILTIISTFSTTGYIVMGIVMTSILFNKRYVNNHAVILTNIFILTATLLLIFNSWVVQEKFSFGGENYNSFEARLTHTQYAIRMILDHPYFGFGYGEESFIFIDEYVRNSLNLGGSTGGSNHFLRFIGQFGIFVSLVFLIKVFKTKQLLNSRVMTIAILIIFFSTEHLITTEITMSLLYFGED